MIVKRKLYSVIDEKERLYFLGEHKGKFGKGGTASGVVFTVGDVLKHGAESRLLLGPKGTNGGKLLDYSNTESGLRMENAYEGTKRKLLRKGVDPTHAVNAAESARIKAYEATRHPGDVVKAIKKQKFNRTALGKILKKIKVR